MSTCQQRVHPPAVAAEMVLYPVVHPVDLDQDQRTRNCSRALASCAQAVWHNGGVYLHAETHHAGQYPGEYLLRQGVEGLA